MISAADFNNLVANLKAQGLTKSEMVIRAAEALLGWPYAWGATGQNCTVSNREARCKNPRIAEGDIRLIKQRCQVLNGSKIDCNGCKYYPDNVTQMHDCIGFVNRILNIAGIPHYGAGCSTMWNHEANWKAKGVIADIPDNMVCLVFQQVKGQPKVMDHIGISIGGGYIIHCSVEVKREKITQYPWSHFGILNGMEGDVPPLPDTKPTLRRGSRGEYVTLLQTSLKNRGYDIGASGADGIFGNGTEAAVKQFQRDWGLKVDGIVGQATWKMLDTSPVRPTSLYTVTIPHISKEMADDLLTKYQGYMTPES